MYDYSNFLLETQGEQKNPLRARKSGKGGWRFYSETDSVPIHGLKSYVDLELN